MILKMMMVVMTFDYVEDLGFTHLSSHHPGTNRLCLSHRISTTARLIAEHSE
jgi:hypothetical protein